MDGTLAHRDLDATLGTLADLIAIPTVSSDSNLALIDYAEARLKRLGARTELSHDRDGAKANLFATIGPDVGGGVVLSGHTDVVPVDGQDWSSDPFRAHDDGVRVFGRGACDMKGFLAAALTLAPRFAETPLARPLHLALTYDEEVGCLGARVLMEALAARKTRPRACIIGEPTEMRVIEGHKGCHEYTTCFTGLEGHGSRPELGVNAVEYAARYVSELLALREELKDRAPADSPFEPPWTTVSVGRIAGGIAHNVIAGHCAVDWEFRPVNAADARWLPERIDRFVETRLLPAMRAVHAEAEIVRHVVGEIAGLAPMAEDEAVRLAAELTGSNARETVAFGTEAGLFQQIGIPTVVCGPGSIMQAHKPDEYVTHDQLSRCLTIIEGLIPRLQP